MITFFLCQQKVLGKPLLYLSEFFRINRQEYYDRLNAAHDKDDLEGWFRFFLEGVSTTARKAAETAGKVLALRERDMLAATSLRMVSANAVKLLNSLYGSPYVRIKDVETITGLSNPNAIALINKMSKLGILTEITGRKRNKIFAYAHYIEAFTAE